MLHLFKLYCTVEGTDNVLRKLNKRLHLGDQQLQEVARAIKKDDTNNDNNLTLPEQF